MAEATQEKQQSLVPFFIMWGGQAISLFGSQLVQFGLIWWLTQETGSATVLAMASLVGFLPQVLVGPVAGALVDRWNRRITMMVADSLVALATLALAYLFFADLAQIWQVYLVLFVRALAGSFHYPAMTASTSLMVPEEHLSRVQGLNQSLQGALNIVAAPLGALLLGLLAVQGVLAIDVITALFAIIPLFFIHVPQPERRVEQREKIPEAQEQSSFWAELREGFHYVRSWRGLMIILVMATFINFVLTPGSALMPLLVSQYFNGDALQLGILEALFGIGVIMGGLTLGVWGGFRRRIATSMVGLMVMGAGFALLGVVPRGVFPLAIAAAFVAGFANPMVNGPIMAILQAVVEPGIQGRVFALLRSAAVAMTPLGLLIAGPVADAVGVQVWFILGGIATAAMGVAGFFVRDLMTIEDDRRASVDAESLPETQVKGVEDSPAPTAI